MPDDTILCWIWPPALQHLLTTGSSSRHVTVKDCNDWLAEADAGREKLAEFFRQRLHERYIDPVLRPSLLNENGFSIIALSCLLMETFETFRQGWDSSNGKPQSRIVNGEACQTDHQQLFKSSGITATSSVTMACLMVTMLNS